MGLWYSYVSLRSWWNLSGFGNVQWNTDYWRSKFEDIQNVIAFYSFDEYKFQQEVTIRQELDSLLTQQ